MDLLATAQYGVVAALAMALLHALWQVALLTAVAAVSLSSLSRRSAALRHAVGMGFLLAMVLAPMVTFLRFWQRPGAELNGGIVPVVTAPSLGAVPGQFVQHSSQLSGWLALLWLLGVAVMLLRHLGGWRLLGTLERRAYQPLPPEWQHRRLDLERSDYCPALSKNHRSGRLPWDPWRSRWPPARRSP